MTKADPPWELQPVIEWLLSDGRFATDLEALAKTLAQRLLSAGAPLWRLRLGVRTLHPLITALGGAWERDRGAVSIPQAKHGMETRTSYIGSPLATIHKTLKPFRRNLRGVLTEQDHGVLHELKARGATDYFGLPLVFSAQPHGLIVLVSDDPDGFSKRDLEQFTALAHYLAPIVEVLRLKHVTTAITEAYLGPRSAARVMSGQIIRGHVETIRASILFSDLRGWTALSTQLPGHETVALANRYYDILGDAVSRYGGEILKLMGDGMLAVFPDEDDVKSCNSALGAARMAQQTARGDPPFAAEFGIGMHVGEVLYGNVGSDTRLDFTVLGSAVNLAARLEKMCIAFDEPIVFSAQFAAHLHHSARLLGQKSLKGLQEPQQVFAP